VVGALVVAALVAPASAGELSPSGFKKLKRTVKAAAAAGDEAALAQALTDLAQDDSKAAVDLILKVAVGFPKGKVLDAAVDGFAGMRNDDAVEALCAPLRKKGGHASAKILCIDGLAGHEDPVSGQALGQALTDKRPEVIRAAIAAIRARKEVKAVDALIDLRERLVKRPDTLLQSGVDHALAEITGTFFEKNEDWRKWWEVKKASFRPTSGGTLPAGMTTGERQKKPTFFGTEVHSERLVFVIDTSGSMEGDRLKKCQEQLVQCIEALNPRSRFTIVSYSHTIKVWNKSLQAATPKNKSKAKEFAQGLKAAGNTFTLSAMKEGFVVKGADAIVLLSDGMPTETDNKGDMISPEVILDELSAENRFKKWRVDTFGFEGAPGGSLSKFMRELAEKNGGKFTPIN
jgi:hypothetical protein